MLEKVAQDGPGSSQVDPRRRPGEECQGCNVGVCKDVLVFRGHALSGEVVFRKRLGSGCERGSSPGILRGDGATCTTVAPPPGHDARRVVFAMRMCAV